MSTENSAVNESALSAEPTPPQVPTLTFSDLKPRMEVTGTVKRIELFGAFVDIGVGKDGLLHISQISDKPIKNVNDVLTEGQTVSVWVSRIDAERERVDLTMLKPLAMPWNELQVGQAVSGRVVRVEKFGVFVDIGAERPGMIHVSELSSGFIGSPDDMVKVGDDLQAKIIKINSRKKQIDMSVKALETPTRKEMAAASGDDDDDKVPTVMELALRRALRNSEGESFPELEKVIQGIDSGASERKGKGGKREKRVEKRRQEQEDLLNRTLKQTSTRA